jgi:hypothetical protein
MAEREEQQALLSGAGHNPSQDKYAQGLGHWSSIAPPSLTVPSQTGISGYLVGVLGRPCPTIGRTVIYHSNQGDCAALVASVLDPGDPESTVNLCVISPGGMPYGIMSVPFGESFGSWSWPIPAHAQPPKETP